MLVAGFIVGLVFIIIILALPFLFKIFFKIDEWKGFLIGLISSLITSNILAGLIAGSVAILNNIIKNKVDNGGIEILINSLNDIEELNALSKPILILVWGVIAIIFLALFLLLFFSIKILVKQVEDSNIIFHFISGFILLPSLFWYIFCILLSFKINMFSKITSELSFNIFNNFFIILIEFGGIFFILLIIGSALMIMLHLGEYNSNIIWICVVIFFAPIILYLIGFLLIKAFFFSFLNGACPLLSFACGCFLFHKYASGPETPLLGTKVEMAS
jgi:hypothetical protein